MKKILTIFCSIFLISSHAYADGIFVGADILRSDIHQTASNNNSFFESGNDSEANNNKMGYGVNAGFRGDVLFLVGSAEIFYDNLNVKARSFPSPVNIGNKGKIADRYGAKVNIGMKVVPMVTPFVSAGLACLDYRSTNDSSNSINSDSKFVPIYGIGALVDLPKGITIKAAYDYQQFDNRSPGDTSINNRLGVVRVGVIYNL